MNDFSTNGNGFDPSADPVIRKWAARFKAEPDHRLVIMTAEIERISIELQSGMQRIEKTVEGKQELWGQVLSQGNQAIVQTLQVVKQQQDHQHGISQSSEKLVALLRELEQALNTCAQRMSESSTSAEKSVSELKSDLQAMKTELLLVKNSFSPSSSEFMSQMKQITKSQAAIENRLAHTVRNGDFPWLGAAIFSLLIFGGCFFWSQKSYENGQVDLANRLFGGAENAYFWGQMRAMENNKERIIRCREQQQAECSVFIP
jgi:hypothetical protein